MFTYPQITFPWAILNSVEDPYPDPLHKTDPGSKNSLEINIKIDQNTKSYSKK